jgi:hypothetical protein
VLNSGYTNHMTEERRMFTSLRMNECPSDYIMFDDNSQVKVIGFGKIAIITKYSISKVLLIESLEYNFLSISQFCEIRYNYLFTNKNMTVFKRSDGSFAFKDVIRRKIYLVNFISEEAELDKCVIVKIDMG